MFYDRTMDHKRYRVYEMALRIAYKVCKNCFGSLLEQTNSVSIDIDSLQLPIKNYRIGTFVQSA